MSVGLIVGVLLVLLTTSCVGVEHLQQSGSPQTGGQQGKTSTIAPAGRATTVAPAQSTGKTIAKTDSPVAKMPSSSAPTGQPGKKEPATLAAKKQPASPPLDLASLENRLKETKAIGLFSKIALKNQVDDLLDQFREFYQGSVKTTLAELRQEYDLLLLKVLSLLQDTDQSLATAIGASREAIWGILADRQKFAAIQPI